MSKILLPKIEVLPENERGLKCLACKSVWTLDFDKLQTKHQLGIGNCRRERDFAVVCPACNFASTVTIYDKIESPINDEAVETHGFPDMLFGYPVRHIDGPLLEPSVEFDDLSTYMDLEIVVTTGSALEVSCE